MVIYPFMGATQLVYGHHKHLKHWKEHWTIWEKSSDRPAGVGGWVYAQLQLSSIPIQRPPRGLCEAYLHQAYKP